MAQRSRAGWRPRRLLTGEKPPLRSVAIFLSRPGLAICFGCDNCDSRQQRPTKGTGLFPPWVCAVTLLNTRSFMYAFEPRALPDNEIDEHRQAVESAEAVLRQWRDAMLSGKAAEDIPPPPTAGGRA